MRLVAYQHIENASSFAEADAIVMDEDAYRELGAHHGPANVVISSDKNYDAPGCYVLSGVGDAVRFAISAGYMTMVVIGKTIYDTAISAYQAEMR